MNLKTILSLSLSILILASCDKEACSSSNGILGEWELVEELMDPGDGSGTFQPVTSDKKIKFCDDGTFTSNGDVCFMGNQADGIQEGTYDASTSTLSPNYCMSMMPMSISYTVNGNTLIISYLCIEGCQQKYCRI